MVDWESDNDAAPPSVPAIRAPAKKWEGEDEAGSEPASDWEATSSEEEEVPARPVAPKKQSTAKTRPAEKRAAADEDDEDEDTDEDADVDPREKARRDREREIQSDLANTRALLGAAAHGGSSSKELDELLSCEPRTKQDFHQFSAKVIRLVIARLQSKPFYPSFVEYHTRQLAQPLTDVEVRRTATALTTLANEKQRVHRDKLSGKKKPKAAAKPALGSAKASGKLDTSVYDEALDDFGTNPDDFM